MQIGVTFYRRTGGRAAALVIGVLPLAKGFPLLGIVAADDRRACALNAADFVKLVSVQRVTRRGLNTIGKTITTLARAEGLESHARSIEVRTR